MSTISVKAALQGIEAGFGKAKEMQVPCSIAVVDAGRNLLAFARDDDAMLGSAEIAQNKAYTAASFAMRTSAVVEAVQPGAPLYGLEVTGDRPYVVFGGGVPVMHEGRMIGAVGVSGGSVTDDEKIADLVAAALAG